MTRKPKQFRLEETTIQMLNLITQSNPLFKNNTHTLENIISNYFIQQLKSNNNLLENIQDLHPDILNLAHIIANSSSNKPEV